MMNLEVHEAIMAYFKVLSQHLTGQTEENHSKPLCALATSPSTIRSPKQYLVKSINYEAPHCVTFSILLLPPLGSKYFPQHPAVKHLQSVFFP